MPDFPHGHPDGWFSPVERVPRRDQAVRVLTTSGVEHRARFSVAHTDHWPSGARWALSQSDGGLPFHDVEAWSADVETPYPTPSEPEPVEPEPVEPEPDEPQPEDEPPHARRPAIVREMLVEIDAVGDLLRRLPPAQLRWTPTPSVPTLHTLALRLVRIVARIDWILDLDYIEAHFEPDLPPLATIQEITSTFNANADSVRSLAETLTAERLRAPWRLERSGDVVSQTPRGDALRRFGLTPLVYHRGSASLMMTSLGIEVPPASDVWTFTDAPTWAAPSEGPDASP